jgi:hypothetical protein
MKNLFLTFALFLVSITAFAQSHVRVRAYVKKDGTYVPSHYRTSKDYTKRNNWTTIGNVNPYTGKAGTLPSDSYSTTRYSNSLYRTPSYSTPKYSRSYSTSSYVTPSYSTSTYTDPVFKNTSYSTPSYSTPSYSEAIYIAPTYVPTTTPTLHTGPRGGVYYINSNGNKSYIN